MNENWTEKLIDAHLEEPNTIEPWLGFESRMVAQVADQTATRKSPALWMVWASAAVATTIIAIVFFARPAPQKPAHVETAKANKPAQPPQTATVPHVGRGPVVATRRSARRQERHEAFAAARDVRQEVFPAPSPLSEQERMAFAYLRGTPRSEVVAMSRPEPELPQEMNQAIPGQEVNHTLQDSRSGSTR
jgi:hypothetical protein